ncbi:MAG: hypothetical protein HY760_01840 [Nitrospirae bacterium]|nr:hypothetical protein [Nitrospirota bacterium]
MRRRKEGQGCFLALLLACTALVVLLFFFYFKGKDLTWNYLQKGVVERSVLPLLPPDYSEKERNEVQTILNGFFDDIRNERIETARAKVIIDEFSRMTEDHRLERGEVDRLMRDIRVVQGR